MISNRVNKKFLYLILLSVIFLPIVASAVNAPDTMFSKAKDMAVTIGASIVVIGWIIAGILYLTAAGSDDKLKTAKRAMIAAFIGTLLVVIAKLGYDAISGLLNPIIGS